MSNDGPNHELEQSVESFLDHLSNGRMASDQTIRAYRSDLKDLMQYLEEQDISRAGDVDRKVMRNYFSHLQESDYKNSTLVRKLASIRSFFDTLKDDGEVRENPTRKMKYPKVTDKLPEFLTAEEMEALLNAPDTDSLTGVRDRAILELLYSTGMRAGELQQLDIEDVDRIGGTIRVRGKGKKERIVPVGEDALSALQNYLQEWKKAGRLKSATSGPLVCNKSGQRLSTRSIRRAVSRNAKKADLSQDVSPHTIRHTFATHMLKNGADLRTLQKILGHENLHTTEVYTHITTDQLKDSYDDAHPRDPVRE